LATSVMTTRGCPYNCGFCCKCNKQVQIYPSEFVNDEVDTLAMVYGYKALMFFDDIFIVDKERALKIMANIKKHGIIWRCFVRADMIVRHGLDFVKSMKDAGCVEVGVGVESGSDQILKEVNKGEDSVTIKKGIHILKEGGLRVKGFFIIGLPGESYETIEETRKFVETSGLDDMDFSIFQPFKKSPIYEFKDKYYNINWEELDLQSSWYKGTPGSYKSQVWTPFLTRDNIVTARDALEKELKLYNA
jgi:anaerobic magnesium-protoporphyrin IX monomethyl ester cyclase